MLSGAERGHMHLRFPLFVTCRGRHRTCMGPVIDFRYRNRSHKVVVALHTSFIVLGLRPHKSLRLTWKRRDKSYAR